MRQREVKAALGPVMALAVDGEWVAVRIAQMDRVMAFTKLYKVPLARPGYEGLLDNGHELVPVLRLDHTKQDSDAREHLVAILHVRGDSVGMVIDRAGHLHKTYELSDVSRPVPEMLAGAVQGMVAAVADSHAKGQQLWLIDTDQLWSV